MTLIDQLKRDEGLRQVPYWDACGHPWTVRCGGHPKGVLTVGYGWNLQNPLPERVCDLLLEIGITGARRVCEAELPEYTGLSPARRDVVANMVFNLGLGGYLEFEKMRAHLKAGAYREAAMEMLNSTWAIQVKTRAERLAQQMMTDEWV